MRPWKLDSRYLVMFAGHDELHHRGKLMTLALLLRGISGSGKSSLSRALCAKSEVMGLRIAVHSTDDLFMTDGQYRFDPNLLSAHHEKTLKEFRTSLCGDFDIVVLDNTNLTMASLLKGRIAAEESHADCCLVQLEPLPIEEHLTRSTHALPREAMEHQYRTFYENSCDISAMTFEKRWMLPALSGPDHQGLLVQEIIEQAKKS